MERTDAEEDLDFSCVVLHAVASEGGVHLVIETADRLEDADRWCVGGMGTAKAVDEGARAPQGEQVVADAGPGKDGGDAGDDGGDEKGVQVVLGTGLPGDCACGAFCWVRSLWSLTPGVVADLTLSHISSHTPKVRCGAR